MATGGGQAPLTPRTERFQGTGPEGTLLRRGSVPRTNRSLYDMLLVPTRSAPLIPGFQHRKPPPVPERRCNSRNAVESAV